MTTPAQFRNHAADGCTLVPVVREVLSDLDTPLSVYLKLADGPHTYLFESVEGGERFGRHSIIGLPARRVYEFRGHVLEVREHGEVVETREVADPLAEEYLLVSSQVPYSPGTGPFLGLGADALGVLQFPPTVPPLHGYLGSDGVQVTVIPPGGVPQGARFDARAVVLNGVVKLSNIVRIQF